MKRLQDRQSSPAGKNADVHLIEESPPAKPAHAPSARTLSVEERLRLSLTLVESTYQLNELAADHDIIQIEAFAPDEVQPQIPISMRALHQQIVAIKAALGFSCLSLECPDVSDRWTQR